MMPASGVIGSIAARRFYLPATPVVQRGGDHTAAGPLNANRTYALHTRNTCAQALIANSSHPGCADLVALTRYLGFPWQEQGVFPGRGNTVRWLHS